MGRLRAWVGNGLKRAGLVYRPTSFTDAQVRRLEDLLVEATRSIELRLSTIEDQTKPERFDAREVYSHDAPSPQNALDIFSGEWSSMLPEGVGPVMAGVSPLFRDDRIDWCLEVLGSIRGKSVLEIGPLEGGHSYMLDRAGAARVVSVEANTRAFLKCLIAKEVLGMPSVEFLYGDAINFLEQRIVHKQPSFDLCLASGVLYHLKDPVAGLDLMTRASDRLFLWTMYYDDEAIQSRPDLAAKFPTSSPANYHGFRHMLYRQEYQGALEFKGFCGGSAASSAWMTREDILRALDFFGFEVVDVGFEGDNGHGPCFAVAARRRSAAAG